MMHGKQEKLVLPNLMHAYKAGLIMFVMLIVGVCVNIFLGVLIYQKNKKISPQAVKHPHPSPLPQGRGSDSRSVSQSLNFQ